MVVVVMIMVAVTYDLPLTKGKKHLITHLELVDIDGHMADIFLIPHLMVTLVGFRGD